MKKLKSKLILITVLIFLLPMLSFGAWSEYIYRDFSTDADTNGFEFNYKYGRSGRINPNPINTVSNWMVIERAIASYPYTNSVQNQNNSGSI